MFKDTIYNHVNVIFSWRDKIKILLGAPVNVSVETKTENLPGKVKAKSKVYVGNLINLGKATGELHINTGFNRRDNSSA